jgi:hypothetical protein
LDTVRIPWKSSLLRRAADDTDAMLELNRMAGLLEQRRLRDFMLTTHGPMRTVVLSVESFAFRQSPSDRGLQCRRIASVTPKRRASDRSVED